MSIICIFFMQDLKNAPKIGTEATTKAGISNLCPEQIGSHRIFSNVINYIE